MYIYLITLASVKWLNCNFVCKYQNLSNRDMQQIEEKRNTIKYLYVFSFFLNFQNCCTLIRRTFLSSIRCHNQLIAYYKMKTMLLKEVLINYIHFLVVSPCCSIFLLLHISKVQFSVFLFYKAKLFLVKV